MHPPTPERGPVPSASPRRPAQARWLRLPGWIPSTQPGPSFLASVAPAISLSMSPCQGNKALAAYGFLGSAPLLPADHGQGCRASCLIRRHGHGVETRSGWRKQPISCLSHSLRGRKQNHTGVSHLLRALSQDNHILCNSLAATSPHQIQRSD